VNLPNTKLLRWTFHATHATKTCSAEEMTPKFSKINDMSL
jgi:hypothetical protein